MRGIAVAIIAAVAIFASSHAYLLRYEIVGDAGVTTYRVHDRWTRSIASCTHLASHKASEAADVDCSTWGPLVGGQP